MAKASYLPKHTRLINKRGIAQRTTERADLLADNFEYKQWGQIKPEGWEKQDWPQQKIIKETVDIRIDDFDIIELKIVLKKCNNNKTPGPDGIPIEFYKWLNEESLVHVLQLLNKIKRLEKLPKTLELAEVVTLYKKRKCPRPGKL